MLGRRALPAGRLARLGATPDFHHGLLDRIAQPLPLVTLSLLSVVLAIDLIGINRGEVIRLWIFLACLLQIPAAWVCARAGRRALALVLITTLLLSALGTANIGFVVPG